MRKAWGMDLLWQNADRSAGAGLRARNPWTAARPRQRPDPCDDECTPSCPACGGLECLCRPRFFPGQLLTDDDLNRLEQYVVDKNKLRNRYLHGWGVACGLEVVCDGCEPETVVVRPGYALSPCGDDIVVCGDQSVNICDLIDQCEPREPQCEPPYARAPKDCRVGRSEWVLGICYDERPSRGITAQLGAGDSPRGGSCSCGSKAQAGGARAGRAGTPAAGCGCGGGGQRAAAPSRRAAQPQCEPTQICEGYRFVVYPLAREEWGTDLSKYEAAGRDSLLAWMHANRARFGPLLERVLCCVIKGMQLRAAIREGRQVAGYEAMKLYTDYADALVEFAADFSTHRCAFLAKVPALRQSADAWRARAAAVSVGTVAQPAAPLAEAAADVDAGLAQLDATWLEILSECLCSALLPHCPPAPQTSCVPLAVITLGGEGCRVTEVCNWQARKLLITWPTVTYWLSWLPWHRVREWIAGLCCGDGRERTVFTALLVLLGSALTKAQASTPVKAAKAAKAASVRTDQAPLDRAFQADNLLLHMLGEFKTIGAQPSAEYPLWASAAAMLSNPSLSVLAAFAGGAGTDAGASAGTGVGLEQRLAAAEKKLEAQDKQIAALKKRK